MSVRVAINGFGRIGRGIVRAAFARQAVIEVVAANAARVMLGVPAVA